MGIRKDDEREIDGGAVWAHCVRRVEWTVCMCGVTVITNSKSLFESQEGCAPTCENQPSIVNLQHFGNPVRRYVRKRTSPIMPPDQVPRTEGMGNHVALSQKTSLVVIVFLALAVSHALEVFIRIFRRFHTYRGVYFYSLIAASTGIVIHALGYFIRNFDISKSAPQEITLACAGGMLMITGQSIVLWSRLHLISPGKRDRWLLYMIIVDCIVVQGTATALFAGSNSPTPHPWLEIYAKWEIFQVTWFVCQECLISGLYIYRTYILMRSSAVFQGPDTKRVFHHLVAVNVIVVALDVTILALQYANKYEIQTSWKTLAYAIKLKLEFHILSQLVAFNKQGLGRSGSRHVSNPSGSGNELRSSRFGNSMFGRADDDDVREFPMRDVVKTTEIEVTSKVDAMSEGTVGGPKGFEQDTTGEGSMRELGARVAAMA
jgi:hypothetical protein